MKKTKWHENNEIHRNVAKYQLASGEISAAMEKRKEKKKSEENEENPRKYQSKENGVKQ